MKNRYIKRSHISEAKFRQLARCFSLDLTATNTAKLCNLNRKTANRIFIKIRQRICSLHLGLGEQNSLDEFELDESYFGPKRVRGKRGRGAAGKTPVFGILKRGGEVHVEIITSCSKAQLMPIIKREILEGTTIHTDGWKAYDSLVVNGYDHYRVYHSKNEFARGKCHVNGIESFWSYAKRRMAKFNGLSDQHFFLHLKECVWRFNFRHDPKGVYYHLLNLCRNHPL